MATTPIEAGQAALREGRWDEARAAFEAALAETEDAEALAGLGSSLWWLGETGRSVECVERAYALHRRAGDVAGAALAAMSLAITYKANYGNGAAANGWAARAARVLGDDPGALAGYLLSTRAYVTSDPAEALALLEHALRIARDSGDADLELVTLADRGERLVQTGRVEEGLALVDEAMAGTLAGEYTRLETVVYTCCDMLTACDHAGDLDRATEWCRVADGFIREYGCPFLYAQCRTIYGGMLAARGRWTEAESELEAALRMTGAAGPALHAQARDRLADLRLRQGRLEEAEALVGPSGDSVGAAALLLARGEASAAAASLGRLVQLTGPESQALSLLVEAHLAAGEREAAVEALGHLEAAATRHGRAHDRALAELAAARVAEGEEAVERLERALGLFAGLELPHESARVRLALAQALAARRPDIAVAEARRAHEELRALGARADADVAAALLRSLGASTRTGPRSPETLTRREQEVLELVGLGLSNPEIAQRLFISRKTASHHVSHVLAKLGLRNRAEAVAYAARASARPGLD